ncbi:threonine--tRNA ligase [Terasakiella sp. A23]|uniref:threonine--tRNA ligase n=1 Tax=Terasakiella sp. FCG-A23 TaxID=3080561 RepID=UPI0029542555|nr:threonine--tRNA ligase [Terasakiella sp. A23]MDV7338248.1 threonine--tRNA ligase [Terasakiella sp. A23]
MVAITLPDGSVRNFDGSVTGAQVAADIGPGLAKAALAIRIDGEMKDLSLELTEDTTLSIVTTKDEDALELLRHDAAHIMAQAVQELYENVQVTIGPAIENGFYYDFATEKPFNDEDLVKIEKKMEEIVDRDLEIVREVWDRDELIAKFKDMGELYKAEIIEGIPDGEDVTVYRQGDWFDMCRGPHLPSTGKLGKAFKLMKVAGAYWRGDSNNEMLQRIYGTAWADKKALRQYLHMLEEAEKRDHRKLGKEMGLFHFQEEAPGAVFWHPKGWKLFNTLISYMRGRQERAGYVEINTPSVMDRGLWEKSGHWEKFGENMFTTQTEDDRVFALKPMNCPGGIQVFKQGITSYKDLPRRIAEFGKVNRYEPSGALHGLMRVREFTQDDAHIFCTPAQMEEECQIVIKLILDIYKDFGFENIRIKFSDRPEKRIGDDATWDLLEEALRRPLESMGLDYSFNPGEGAFYGPKLEFVLRDAIGRDWQCGTLQVDMNLTERLDVTYIDEKGEKQRPVMLHRALFGSLERFTGILTEHYAGRFPLWLAPQQVVVAPIVSAQDDYAREVCETLRQAGISCETDLRNEKINYKIREHSHAKIPVILVVGDKEVASKSVAMRRLGGKTQEILALDEAVTKLVGEAASPQGK